MSSESSGGTEEVVTEILEVQSIESSEEPPMEEWSSLLFQLASTSPAANPKRRAYAEGLYDIGSGEVCTKYIAQSDSSVFRHPYYNYPAVLDPGIVTALCRPEVKIVYSDDGQELYLAICKQMNQSPVRIFYNSLLNKEINLRYYCVDPQGVRAMAEALKFNKNVQVIDLTDNFLSDDASYHLGNMLQSNVTLVELNLEGCRIGPSGAKRLLAGLVVNRTLKILNLSRNALTEVGGEIVAEAMARGLDVKQLNLSSNGLGSKTAAAFAEAWEYYNKLSHLDLSKNNFFSPLGTCSMINRLQENEFLEELYLSWNAMSGPRISASIQRAMNAPHIRVLDLSYNKFQGEAIDFITADMSRAKKLHTLNLSFNPLDAADAYKVLSKLRLNAVKLQRLYMDNVDIKADSLHVLQRIQKMKSKKDVKVTFGGVTGSWKAVGPDPREIVLNRVEYLSKAKKHKADVPLLVLELAKSKIEIMDVKDFQAYLKSNGAGMIDEDLIDEIANTFPGPRTKKSKRLNVGMLTEFIKRKFPDRQLPPTPPPAPEPLPPPPAPPKEEPKKGAKGKKK